MPRIASSFKPPSRGNKFLVTNDVAHHKHGDEEVSVGDKYALMCPCCPASSRLGAVCLNADYSDFRKLAGLPRRG